MASEALSAVLERARQDPHFYQLLQSDPARALADYPLSQTERLALLGRDRGALVELGVPVEWAHWFGVQH